MRTSFFRFIVSLTVAVLATAGVSVATASPAIAAVPCGPSAPDRDPGSAQVVNPVSGYPGPAMRTGPGLNCGILIRPPWGAVVPMNCYRVGDTGAGDVRTWTAVHYGGHFGWVNDYYLSDRGSNYAC
jgi:hypothetical protein